MKKITYPALLIASFLFAATVSAHQPELANGSRININDPEISRAYYGELRGESAVYTIDSADQFILYANILVPDIKDVAKDKTVKIEKVDGEKILIAEFGGEGAEWKNWYEPFAGDSYFQGPEYRTLAEPGKYEITVSSPDNRGKYVLATGDAESFPAKSWPKTMLNIVKLKMGFFHEPFYLILYNRIGLFFAIIILAIVLIGLLIRGMYKKNLKIEEMDYAGKFHI